MTPAKKRGVILVTGVAGSGKSTALAAMIQYMNTHAERHVITLEDPVEMLFTEDRCVISQREVGTDCESFTDELVVWGVQDENSDDSQLFVLVPSSGELTLVGPLHARADVADAPSADSRR